MLERVPSWLVTLVRVFVTVGVFGLILSQIDLDQLAQRLLNIPLWVPVLAFLLQFSQFLINVWRWWIVLGTIHTGLSLVTALKIMLVAQFFGQVMPSAIGGDMLRVWYARREGVPVGLALSSLILERTAGLATIALMILVTMPLVLATITDPAKQTGLFVAALLVIFGLVTLFLLDRLPVSWQRFRLVRFVAELGRQARQLVSEPIRCAKLIAMSALGMVCLSLAAWMIVHAIGGTIDVLTCLLVIPPSLLVTALPISIGGWGIREGAMIIGLSLGNVSPEIALATSLIYGLLSTATGLPGGVVWLTLRGGTRPVVVEEEGDQQAALSSGLPVR